MRYRCRDFLVTAEGLVFSVTEYLHPKDWVFGMLRFIRFPVSGFRFPVFRKPGTRNLKPKKLGTTLDSCKYLKKHHPEYLFPIDSAGTLLQAVPENKIVKVIRPDEFLSKLKPDDSFKKKILDLAGILSKESKVPLRNFGVTGSVLVNAHNESSDIDVVVYGLRNFQRVRACMPDLIAKGITQKLGTTAAFFPHYCSGKNLGKTKKLGTTAAFFPHYCSGKNLGKTKKLGTTHWKKLYEKRLPHKELSFKEFIWHAERKNNVGLFDGTKFDLLCTRDWDEISGRYGEVEYEKLGTTCMQAKILDDTLAFDYPARFKVKTLEGKPVSELVSYTHTYAGQARKGETIEVQGVLEKVISRKESHLRLLVGSTREARGEYIKVI